MHEYCQGPLSQPCFDHFFGPCFRGYDEAVVGIEALQGLRLPEARRQSEAHGDYCWGPFNDWWCGSGTLWCLLDLQKYCCLWKVRQFWQTRSLQNLIFKAKFRKRHGSRKWEEENSATRRRHRGKGRKRQKTPSPPTMCHTPHWASAGRVASITLYFSNAGNASAAIFWRFFASAMVLRKGSPASAGASAGTRWQMWIKNGWFSGPCLATLLPRLIEIARVCNHSSEHVVKPPALNCVGFEWRKIGVAEPHSKWTKKRFHTSLSVWLGKSCRRKFYRVKFQLCTGTVLRLHGTVLRLYGTVLRLHK